MGTLIFLRGFCLRIRRLDRGDISSGLYEILRYAAIEGSTSTSTPDCEASRIPECPIAYGTSLPGMGLYVGPGNLRELHQQHTIPSLSPHRTILRLRSILLSHLPYLFFSFFHFFHSVFVFVFGETVQVGEDDDGQDHNLVCFVIRMEESGRFTLWWRCLGLFSW